MNDANKHWFSKEDIVELKAYCHRRGIGWNISRELLLLQGSNGRLSDNAFGKYKKLLMRILYEMERKQNGLVIHTPIVIEGLPDRYFKGIAADPMVNIPTCVKGRYHA